MAHIEGVSKTKRAYWSKLISEHRAGSESVRQFCRRHGIGEHSFYWWRRRLAADPPVRFALLETRPTPPAAAAAIEVALRGGDCLRIRAGVDAATLRLVLDAVRR